MRFCPVTVASFWCVAVVAAAAEPTGPLATGLKNPSSVCYGPEGLLYVAEVGEFGRDRDGKILAIRDGRTLVFAEGLNDPMGITYFREALYVADKTKIVRIDKDGQATDYMTEKDFPERPVALRHMAVDAANGIFLVSDAGDENDHCGAIYRIDVRLHKINTVATKSTTSALRSPQGVVFDGASFMLVANSGTKSILRIRLSDGAAQPMAMGIDGIESLVWDHFGRLYIGEQKTGRVLGIPRPGQFPVAIADNAGHSLGSCLDAGGERLIIPNLRTGELITISTSIPGWQVDDSSLPVDIAPAFPNLSWTGWDDGSESGKISSFRPILLTHAGDGSNRVFVATQQGVVHVFNNDDAATKTKIFLDLTDRVRYNDKQNEEGFLGLAFHPDYAKNGELYVFYTDAHQKGINVVSRFHVSRDAPDVADRSSEEMLIRFEKPDWNHDGGTIAFGPDGDLFIAHGDGGGANDPQGNGQSLTTLLGKVLRIDVNHKADGKNYAIPVNNPFRNKNDAAPEIWCYGLRNVWRMAFDRKTGQLWAGDVGQNLFEEIDLLRAGGNYGWNLREGFHPFGDNGADVSQDLIEPIWEYDHDVGKSITGGVVYRGKRIPELQGAYLYADYVAARLWALRFDSKLKRVVANHPLSTRRMAAMSFGEDEQGEAYVMEATANGRGIYRFVKTAGK